MTRQTCDFLVVLALVLVALGYIALIALVV